ncbi:MAG TPA: acyltransferase [Acidobacteriota bacterium]|nr:acyltransferase [Acidobacteriota bacterium]
MGTLTTNRRHDLDWLRVLAILLLHVFHTGMAFNSWGWHIKNADRLTWLDLPMSFLHQWRMPLLFFISGVGTTFALRSRGLSGFVKERHRRLLWPLIFGMLLIIPPQVYCERLYSGVHYASYWDFYRTVFHGVPYPQGNTTWHHLWFVAYLFVYSLLSVPLLAAMRHPTGKSMLERLQNWLSRGVNIYVLVLPLALVQLSLRRYWATQQNLVADWANFSFQLFHFWCGLVVASHPGIWERIEGLRRISLGIGLATLGTLLIDDLLGVKGGYRYSIEYSLLSVLTWSWLLTVLGYGKHYLNFRNRFIEYANEGIYPFYILHQTVIIVIGYYLISWSMGPTAKFLGLLFLSFTVSVLTYELFIRRWNWIRPCFGLKVRVKEQAIAIGSRASVA